jgi:hypothetical protein
MSVTHTKCKQISLEKNFFELMNELKTKLNSLKSFILSGATSNIDKKIDEYFIIIYNLLEGLINITKANSIQNESMHRKNEEKIRILYSKNFNKKLMNDILENRINILSKKEKEYELLKLKTGAIVCNGQIICNERKDNEIIILRTENSLLKSAIKNNEDLLKEKNDIINALNNDITTFKSQLDELNKYRHGKYSSFSNINININESKTDYNQKTIINKKPLCCYNNTLQAFKSKKNLGINNQNETNNNNALKNIYSAYQMNSQMINRLYKNRNKNRLDSKERIMHYYNESKNNKDNKDSSNKKTNSIKYISVNKSLFSPKSNKNNKLEFDSNDKKTIESNKKTNKKFLINNKFSNRDYNSLTIDSNIKKKSKIKKLLTGNNKHNKSNSIQCPENSIKQLLIEKNQQSLSIENNRNSQIPSTTKRISQKKNKNNSQTLKKNLISLPPSILTTITEGFRKNKKINKCLADCLISFTDKNKENKGRNNNNYNDYNLISDIIKDNSLSFIQKTFMNRTISDNNDKKTINNIYNNSQGIYRNKFMNEKNK